MHAHMCLPWNAADIFRDSPLEKTGFPVVSRCHLQIASWLGVGFASTSFSQCWDFVCSELEYTLSGFFSN